MVQLRSVPKTGEVSRALQLLADQARAGHLNWRAGVGEQVLGVEVAAVVDVAWRAGVPVAEALSELARELERSHHLHREGQRLQRLLATRTILAVLAAVMGRLVIHGGLVALLPINRGDGMAWLLGILVAMMGQVALRYLLPVPWLVGANADQVAAQWLSLRLFGRLPPRRAAAPWGAPLAALRNRELQLGVSLRRQRCWELTQIGRGQRDDHRRRLGRLGDLLPFWELWTAGLPALLLLVGPLG